MIIEVEQGYLVELPKDVRKPIVSNWSDGTTTLEFFSELYVMEYDTFEYGVDEDKQRKEITLGQQGEYSIYRRIPKKLQHLINNDNLWLYLKIK